MANISRAARRDAEITAALPSTPAPIADDMEPKAVRVRKPFGQHRQKLAYNIAPGFHGHWFNDDPGNVDRAKEAGYDHVVEKGKPVSSPVGVARDGGVLIAYLMQIPQEWYDEDMREQQKGVDETDRAIRSPSQNDGRYVPSRGINIREEMRRSKSGAG
jgi:hypothetical protein